MFNNEILVKKSTEETEPFSIQVIKRLIPLLVKFSPLFMMVFLRTKFIKKLILY